MALINCPECSREISNTVNACPHCGYNIKQVENTSEPQKVEVTAVNLNVKRKILSGKFLKISMSLLLLIILAVIGITLNSNNNAKVYKENLKLLANTTLDSASIAESALNLTARVWSDAIYKEYDPSSAPYTIQEGSYYSWKDWYSKYEYVEDFNVALSRLYSSAGTEARISGLKADKILVTSIMKKLNNPPRGLEQSYSIAEELFSAYTSLVDLAINPSGSLQTFSQKKSDFLDSYLDCYRRLDIKLSN